MKACTTSLESTVKAAMEMLGTTSSQLQGGGGDYVWATTSALPRGGLLPRRDRSAWGYKAYMVSLSGRHEGPTVSMLAFCHFDTSGWNPMHPAFQILNTHPGGSTPVCHFMSYGNLAFVKKAGTA
ncbi:unnamed protein product [Miscanthus lutarioriparius]|uniref:BURP domain-containing protein n=1 Tax=Miscanthus lutarioriparius TaxID=422564 RepID=A0A811RB46_9POAL|nr:unnamed protein product [Miscanthus lutarioriparius]